MMANIAITTFLTERIQKLKIAVIGDVMLDRYFRGEVKRISPEAPVPINKISDTKSVLGGAANGAANLAGLQCKVFMGGVTGDDDNRKLLLEIMRDAGINCKGLVKSKARKTITKLRVVGGAQQMLRMDFEETGELLPVEVKALQNWLLDLLKDGLDGIIISDYAKGVCAKDFTQWIIAQAHKAKIPVLIDPKGNDWRKYRGCDFITPNVKEMNEALGENKANEDTEIVTMARQAVKKFGIKNVVVTRSEKGMSLVNSKQVIHSPATAIEVFDVSGAGDTAAATLLAAVAGGMSKEQAVYMANRASGIVVAKVGTYAVHRNELLKDVLEEERKEGKGYRTLSWEEIANLAATWHACGETIVFTNGCFDLLHVGHVTYLEKAKALGKHLVIGLNSDKSVRRLKGKTRPLVHEMDRARVLAALGCVDAVVLFEQDTPTELVKLIRPDILVKGGDYKASQLAGRQYAGKVEILNYEKGYSTTGVVEKIAKLAKEGKI
ncbi:MAG: D-glycero-beta-D-manno-heptose-7-phosphate kinase [Acidaminococcaceae bacterium]|nr:D-glycero-beta-D-manno-heptose-7-phosphate kinase [Acidaminococcaceae bacterium]